MTSPGGQVVGRVSVRVLPDTSEFSKRLRAQLKAIKDDLTVDLHLDTASAQASFQKFKQTIERRPIEVAVRFDQRGGLGGAGGGGSSGMFSRLSRGFGGVVTNGLGTVQSAVQATSKSFRGLFELVSDGMSTAVGSFSEAGSALAKLGKNVLSLASSFAQMFAVFSLISVVTSAISVLGGTITAAVGAISAGLAGLPVVLTALVGPIGAVVAGFDGIKNAAQSLQPDLERIQDSLSSTFERGLTPVFERLSSLTPVIEQGLDGIAQKLVEAADGVSRMVTTEPGLTRIQNAFSGIQTFLDGIGPSAQGAFEEMLKVAGTEQLYRTLSDTVSILLDQFTNWLTRMQMMGRLQEALKQVNNLLEAMGGFLTEALISATDFFIGAGPGLTSFFESLSAMLREIDWESVGAAFGNMMSRLGEAIKRP